MTLDPRLGVYLNVVIGILTALLGCTAAFTNILGTQNTAIAMAVIAILLAVSNSILHAIPSAPNQDAKFAFGPKEIK